MRGCVCNIRIYFVLSGSEELIFKCQMLWHDSQQENSSKFTTQCDKINIVILLDNVFWHLTLMCFFFFFFKPNLMKSLCQSKKSFDTRKPRLSLLDRTHSWNNHIQLNLRVLQQKIHKKICNVNHALLQVTDLCVKLDRQLFCKTFCFQITRNLSLDLGIFEDKAYVCRLQR